MGDKETKKERKRGRDASDQEDRKEKKGKKEGKKEKRKHKSHKKKHRKEKKAKREHLSVSKGSSAVDRALGEHLSRGLLEYPDLIVELPSMFSSLDNGEAVNVEAISHEGKRAYVRELMEKHLPVLLQPQALGGGWCKQQGLASLSDFVVMTLRSTKQIVQPAALTNAQAQASRTAPLYLLSLLEKCPSVPKRQQLVRELCSVFEHLLSGNTVQLDGLEDEDVAEGLERLLGSLQVPRCGEEGFAVGSDDATSEAVRLLLSSLQSAAESWCKGGHGSAEGEGVATADFASGAVPGAKKNARSSSSSSSSSPSSSQSSGSDSDSEESDQGDAKALAQAQAQAQAHGTSASRRTSAGAGFAPPGPANEDEDEDEDELGPRPAVDVGTGPVIRVYAATAAHDGLSSLPIGIDPSEASLWLGQGQGQGSRLAAGRGATSSSTSTTLPKAGVAAAAAAGAGTGASGREEWMLVPGEAGAGADLLSETFGTGRKFMDSKAARKAAALLRQGRGKEGAASAGGGAQGETSMSAEAAQHLAAEMEAFNALRGPSLVEIHAAKLAAKRQKNGGRGGAEQRQGFDYARDMAMHRRVVGSNEARALLDEARKLDSKFDKSIQR